MKLLRARLRPMLRIETALLVVVAWLVGVMNGPWWSAAVAGRTWSDPASWLFLVLVFAALVALHFVLLAPFMSRWTVRPLLTLVVLCSAAAGWFMRNYAVMMDPTMIQNILETDVREANELMTWSMLSSVLLWSAIPVAFIWLVRFDRRPWARALGVRVACVAGALVFAVLAVLPVNRDLTSMMRNHRELRYLITPGNFIYGLAARSLRDARDVTLVREPVGTDARLMRVALAPRPRVFVLVVGETVRAANIGLLGYSRQTTPELAGLDVTAFRNVTSCGTSTEVSVPCMFSQLGRADYDEYRIRNSEGLLNVLARAGYAVKWLDNQSGCKGVCSGPGIEYEKVAATTAPELCKAGECYDGILVRRLVAELPNLRQDTVIVLHMMGNHGPAYYRRYPPEFRQFMPDCPTAELRQCTREQVVNAYDNAVLYMDHVLAGVIHALEAHAGAVDAAMLYVSDHGESLGENGIYLHGLPYSIAPANQTHVPMITWVSNGFAAAALVNRRCVHARAGDRLSHDNVFHSLLGVLDVGTTAYRPERDLFADCREAPARSYAAR